MSKENIPTMDELKKEVVKLYEHKNYATTNAHGDWALTVETYDHKNNRMALIYESIYGNMALFIDGSVDERTGEYLIWNYGDESILRGNEE